MQVKKLNGYNPNLPFLLNVYIIYVDNKCIYIFLIEIKLIYNVVLVSGIQQSDSVQFSSVVSDPL